MNESNSVSWNDVVSLICGYIGKARVIASEMTVSESVKKEIEECFDVYREYSRMQSKPSMVCKMVDELYNEICNTVRLLANCKELGWIQ